MFTEALPQEVQTKIDANSEGGVRLRLAGRRGTAFEAHRRLYQELLTGQPPGHRWHKGEPLHNMGVCREQADLPRQAVVWFIHAFIEDVLTRSEESPALMSELQMPAAHALRPYGLTEGRLEGLGNRIRRMKQRRGLIADPRDVFLSLHLDRVVDSLRLPADRSEIGEEGEHAGGVPKRDAARDRGVTLPGRAGPEQPAVRATTIHTFVASALVAVPTGYGWFALNPFHTVNVVGLGFEAASFGFGSTALFFVVSTTLGNWPWPRDRHFNALVAAVLGGYGLVAAFAAIAYT